MKIMRQIILGIVIFLPLFCLNCGETKGNKVVLENLKQEIKNILKKGQVFEEEFKLIFPQENKAEIYLVDTSVQVAENIVSLYGLNIVNLFYEKNPEIEEVKFMVHFPNLIDEKLEKDYNLIFNKDKVFRAKELFKNENYKRGIDLLIRNLDSRKTAFIDAAVHSLVKHYEWFQYDNSGVDLYLDYIVSCDNLKDNPFSLRIGSLEQLFEGTDEKELEHITREIINLCE